MKPEYEPKNTAQKLGYLVEECGEVLAAVGKSQRWGLDSVNPELPPEKQEANVDWILRELEDLELALNMARDALRKERNQIVCRHPEHKPKSFVSELAPYFFLESKTHTCPNCGLVTVLKS